jgi:hypothetical protein
MPEERVNKGLNIAASAAFLLAAVMTWWRVIQEGPTVRGLLPAVCFTFGGVIWMLIGFSKQPPGRLP